VVERTRMAATKTWGQMKRRPIAAIIAVLVIAGGISTALIAGASPYTGCGVGYAGPGNTNYASGYGTCPPSGGVTITSSQSGTSSTPGGSVTVTNDGVTVTAGGGEGTLTVSQYSGDPESTTPGGATGEYLDISLSTGNSFTFATVSDSNLNGGNTLVYWNGTNWAEVVGDPGPTFSQGPPPTVSLTLNGTTTPTLGGLTGTPFAVSTAAPPGAPTGLSATAGDSSASFTWSAPTSDGGSPITSYTVTCTPSGTATVSGTSATVTGLKNGTAYSCTVSATNTGGNGPASSAASVTPSGTAPPPPPPPPSKACAAYSGNQAFICQVYEVLLVRAPDAGGLTTWTTALAGGTSRSTVAYDIATSNEYRTDIVEGYYQHYLHRAADPGGLSTWVAALSSGQRQEQVISGIVGSGEFYTDAGSTSNGFINSAYEDMLNRPADAGGLATWSAAISKGATRTQVADSIATSNEYRTDIVGGFYGNFLHRPADAGGLSFWVGQLGAGATDEQVASGIIGSAEFFADATS